MIDRAEVSEADMRYSWIDTVSLLIAGALFYSIIPEMQDRLTAAGVVFCIYIRGRALVQAEIARRVATARD